MKYLFITLLTLAFFSCNNKKQKSEQELDKIAYREAEFGMTKEEVLKLDICKEGCVFKDAILLDERYSKIGSRNFFIELQFRDNILHQVEFYGSTRSFEGMKNDLKYLKKIHYEGL